MSDRASGSIVAILENVKHEIGRIAINQMMEKLGLTNESGAYRQRGSAYDDGNYYDHARAAGYGSFRDRGNFRKIPDYLDMDTNRLYSKDAKDNSARDLHRFK